MTSKRWVMTIWDETPPEFDDSWMGYLLYGHEVAPTTGRSHWQCYMETLTRRTRQAIIDKLACDIHPFVAVARGDEAQNAVYCTKDEEYVEWGEPMKQGQRNDLLELVGAVNNGEVTLDQVLIEDPMAYHQYGRTLMAAQDLRLRRTQRNWVPEVVWYWGATETGKSRKANEEAINPYRWRSNDHGWWDRYESNEHVIFDDFRANIQFSELLQMLDRYPYEVPRRGVAPIPFVAKKIWFTSSKHPRDLYAGVGEDIEQLLRRITHIVEFKKL